MRSKNIWISMERKIDTKFDRQSIKVIIMSIVRYDRCNYCRVSQIRNDAELVDISLEVGKHSLRNQITYIMGIRKT